MSNARSPRDVCSTTIGIRGLIRAPSSAVAVQMTSLRGARGSLLARWCPQLLVRLVPILLGCPDALTRLVLPGAFCGLLFGDRLHLGGDPVERPPHADRLAHAVGAAFGEEPFDGPLPLP